jgi:hypothetical protein
MWPPCPPSYCCCPKTHRPAGAPAIRALGRAAVRRRGRGKPWRLTSWGDRGDAPNTLRPQGRATTTELMRAANAPSRLGFRGRRSHQSSGVFPAAVLQFAPCTGLTRDGKRELPRRFHAASRSSGPGPADRAASCRRAFVRWGAVGHSVKACSKNGSTIFDRCQDQRKIPLRPVVVHARMALRTVLESLHATSPIRRDITIT